MKVDAQLLSEGFARLSWGTSLKLCEEMVLE